MWRTADPVPDFVGPVRPNTSPIWPVPDSQGASRRSGRRWELAVDRSSCRCCRSRDEVWVLNGQPRGVCFAASRARTLCRPAPRKGRPAILRTNPFDQAYGAGARRRGCEKIIFDKLANGFLPDIDASRGDAWHDERWRCSSPSAPTITRRASLARLFTLVCEQLADRTASCF